MTGEGLPVHHRSMRRLPSLAALAIGLSACTAAASPVGPGGSTASGSPPSPRSTAGATFSAESRGLQLVAVFDRVEVEAGGDVSVRLSLHNTRSNDVLFEEPCGADAMVVEVPNPREPAGREWEGIAGVFKAYALGESTGSPIESSIRSPLKTIARALPCHAATEGEPGLERQTIAAGDTYETTLTWSAELVRDLPAGPGELRFSIDVLYDLESVGNGMVKAETLAVDGTITVLPGGPSTVSAGQAVDAVLADPEFTAWLSKQPRNSWANANLFLQPGATGVDVLPEVPYWDVELFREPRNWAIVYVDARSGAILRTMYCEIPCDR